MDFELFKERYTTAEAKQLNPLVLAYIGDSVFEVFVRNYILYRNKDMNVHKMHVHSISFVKAHSQSEFMKGILEELSEEEVYIYKRGRNTKSSVPKNADLIDYRNATGFEAIFGYLYLTGQNERMNYLLEKVIKLNGGLKSDTKG